MITSRPTFLFLAARSKETFNKPLKNITYFNLLKRSIAAELGWKRITKKKKKQPRGTSGVVAGTKRNEVYSLKEGELH